MAMTKRLQKELMAIQKDSPPGVRVDFNSITDFNDMTQWIVDIEGAERSLYEGEHFRLSFKFFKNYPFEAPEVTFIPPNIPINPHVYENGHICLSILSEDWSPALSVMSVCLSIVSMLSSCTDKRRPPDNAFYIRTCSKSPKKTKWWYHDDSV